MTRWELHVTDWSDCQRCELAKARTNVVLARGSIPADILFIGEAPGESEDIVGQPFVGPAGRLLQNIIDKSVPTCMTYCLTNLVACIPTDQEGKKAGQPDLECIVECKPRLEELIEMVEPKLVIGVGALARNWLERGLRDEIVLLPFCKVIDILHPAAILRANLSQRDISVYRCVITIQKAIEELDNANS